MISWATTAVFTLLWAYASALPQGTSKINTVICSTPHNQNTATFGGYVYVTITDPSTATYTSTIFSTETSNPAEKYSIITITKTALVSPAVPAATPTTADVIDSVNQLNAQQTQKQSPSLQVTATIHLTKTKTTKNHNTSTLVEGYQALDQNDGPSEIVETVTHTIFNTVSATKRPAPVTKFVTVTHTIVKTGKPATILTTTKKVTTTMTSVTATKTVTSMLKLSTQSDGKRDIILWKRDHSQTEYVDNGSTSTSTLSSVETIQLRAVPTALRKTNIKKTYTPSTTVYTTKTITDPGTWLPWTDSTTIMTITVTAGVGGLQPVEQQIYAITVATETIVEPILSTIPPDPPTTSVRPTTSIKTVDVTEVVPVSKHHTSTVTKTKTHVVTSTRIPPISVVTKTTTIMDSVTISAIYTMFLVEQK